MKLYRVELPTGYAVQVPGGSPGTINNFTNEKYELELGAEFAAAFDEPTKGAWVPTVRIKGRRGGTGYKTVPLANVAGWEALEPRHLAPKDVKNSTQVRVEGRATGGAHSPVVSGKVVDTKDDVKAKGAA